MEYHSENFGGTYEFRCKRHTSDFLVNAHLHEYSEILYVDKGNAEIIVQNNKMVIPEKHLIFIPPNYVHQLNCRNAVTVCAVFSNDFIPLFFDRLRNKFIECTPVDFSTMPYLIENLDLSDPNDYLLISGKLYLICDEILKNSCFSQKQPMDSLLYQKIISYVQNHYSENITLKYIAKKFGYNEKYLSSNIHTLTGMNFAKFRSIYRINHAKQLLNNEAVSICEAAFSSGFSSINTFNRVFKEFVGTTPTDYRKGIKKH